MKRNTVLYFSLLGLLVCIMAPQKNLSAQPGYEYLDVQKNIPPTPEEFTKSDKMYNI